MLNTLLYYLPLLICPIGMGIMMWTRSKSQMRDYDPMTSCKQPLINPTERLATLHAQRLALEAEIATVTKMKELEEQRGPLH